MAWFVRFIVVWIIAEFGCVSGALEIGGLRSPIVVLTIASIPFLAVAGAAVFVGWRRRRSPAGGDETRSSASFMGRAGIIASGIFLVIMMAEMVPIFYFLDECRSFSLLLEL